MTLSGSATSDVADCMDEVQVNLQRAVGDTGVFKTVDTAFTDEGGTFIRELSPNVSGSYRLLFCAVRLAVPTSLQTSPRWMFEKA